MVYKENLADKSNYGGIRNVKNIKYIVIHYTANDGDTDEANANYFARNKNLKASAHYFVDDDSYTLSVPDNYIAYSVGGAKWNNAGGRLYGIATNSNSLSIELCDTTRDGVIKASHRTIENALKLVGMKMAEYNIPIERVIRHYDVNGKTCPAFWVDNELWEREFLSKLGLYKPVYCGVDYSPVFDAEFYRTNNPDIANHPYYGQSNQTLFEHFIKYGFKEKNRLTHPKFNINVYKNENLDLNILLYNHYCNYGRYENSRKTV